MALLSTKELTDFTSPVLVVSVKLGIWMEMSGLKLCKALASTCGLHRSLDGCLKFRKSGQSRRVWS